MITFGKQHLSMNGKLFNFFLMLSILSLNIIRAQDSREVDDIFREVFRGRHKYTMSDIDSVVSQSNLPPYQRVILEFQMLSGIEDESRYKRAIEISTDYINTGDVSWAKDYLRMQRGFIYGLLGERDKGANDLKYLIDNSKASSINAADDVLLSVMKERNPDLEIYFDSVMRQSLGFYYLDFHKDAPMLEEAYVYFSGIQADFLKEKCLEQLKQRIGEESYLDLLRIMADKQPEKNGPTDSMNDIPDAQDSSIGGSSELIRESKKRGINDPNDIKQETSEATKDKLRLGWWLMGIIGVLILVILAWRARAKSAF